MEKQKFKFTFHNPNKIDDKYIDQLLNVLFDANRGKVDRALQAAAEKAQASPAAKSASY